ncbi:MAG: protein-methionine-sulfoxide reductase heme-binding subunit MsrQ [Chloroflexota bacterium]|nr:sulfoxide reductase heme-binding subunit YedZ [Anaerolineales bacterium]
MKLNRKTTARLLTIVTHVGSLLPLALLLWAFFQDQLGADPIREMTLRTGKTAIILLTLSLACTPLNIWFGWKQLLPLRKPLGLYAFLYVSVHLLIFVWLDYGLSWALIQEAIFEKYYALVGFAAFLILLPLAATSTKWAMRKLGKKWKPLHKWVYLAGILAVLHYFLLVKNTYAQPVVFGTILALLLLTRITAVKKRIGSWRRKLSSRMSRVSPTAS